MNNSKKKWLKFLSIVWLSVCLTFCLGCTGQIENGNATIAVRSTLTEVTFAEIEETVIKPTSSPQLTRPKTLLSATPTSTQERPTISPSQTPTVVAYPPTITPLPDINQLFKGTLFDCNTYLRGVETDPTQNFDISDIQIADDVLHFDLWGKDWEAASPFDGYIKMSTPLLEEGVISIDSESQKGSFGFCNDYQAEGFESCHEHLTDRSPDGAWQIVEVSKRYPPLPTPKPEEDIDVVTPRGEFRTWLQSTSDPEVNLKWNLSQNPYYISWSEDGTALWIEFSAFESPDFGYIVRFKEDRIVDVIDQDIVTSLISPSDNFVAYSPKENHFLSVTNPFGISEWEDGISHIVYVNDREITVEPIFEGINFREVQWNQATDSFILVNLENDLFTLIDLKSENRLLIADSIIDGFLEEFAVSKSFEYLAVFPSSSNGQIDLYACQPIIE